MDDQRIARTSEQLRMLARHAPERVSLGLIAEALGTRLRGIAVLCMALPNCLPGPYLPGVSTVLALPIIWIGGQMALGHPGHGLPQFLRRMTFARDRFMRFVDRVAPWLVRMERWVDYRPSALTTAIGRRCVGAVLIFYGLVLALPMPFGSFPIGFSIAALALGLIEADSRALGIGLGIGVLGCLWEVLLVTLWVEAIAQL
ncbi:MAG TPA: exopolysaccharide biosynthesis protein [Stellaceae bacterium]|nr:exopolysaccharide biosynthesis protein [Stellaceae bacterium]